MNELIEQLIEVKRLVDELKFELQEVRKSKEDEFPFESHPRCITCSFYEHKNHFCSMWNFSRPSQGYCDFHSDFTGQTPDSLSQLTQI